ncbi:MAG TPA: putative toxin-antitoxin system toxin component, PIN family [Thermoanaerobaculia bacterium]|nr:putative toxin-antitoxin system toxin component, PIN family [Thermoanaerobaculia bacterium]
MTRVCLDSNVLVAAFVARGLCADVLRLVLAEHVLIVPEVVAEEVRRVLAEKLRASREAISAVDAVLDRCGIVPRADELSPIKLRDPDDELVLAGAIAGGAAILVTGDEDLLVVAEESPIRILSPKAFLALARGGGAVPGR